MSGKIKGLIEKITADLKKHESAVIAFSGGVDSSIVAALAHMALGEKALAVTIDSPLLPYGELTDAKRVAKHIGIKHLIVKFNELNLPRFPENPPNRCYICKKARFKLLKEIAENKGFKTVADGTNIDDSKEYRPGIAALKEENIYSPLLEHNVNKYYSRKIASLIGLPTANKPSNTCLATRFPYNHKINLNKLKRVKLAEAYIKRKLNVQILRVRDHNGIARIEIDKNKISSTLNNQKIRVDVVRKLKKIGFNHVTLDLEGYQPGIFDKNVGAS
jgi:uncharacterized protein